MRRGRARFGEKIPSLMSEVYSNTSFLFFLLLSFLVYLIYANLILQLLTLIVSFIIEINKMIPLTKDAYGDISILKSL